MSFNICPYALAQAMTIKEFRENSKGYIITKVFRKYDNRDDAILDIEDFYKGDDGEHIFPDECDDWIDYLMCFEEGCGRYCSCKNICD